MGKMRLIGRVRALSKLDRFTFNLNHPVIPAQAGTQTAQANDVAMRRHNFLCWVPACAGMTIQD